MSLPPRANFDADGVPLLSWRVHLLPYLGEERLYEQFHIDEPWDSEHNAKLIHQMPDVYAHPLSKVNAQGRTCFVVPVGSGCVFSGTSGTSFRMIRDGTSNTVAVLAVNESFAVPWTKPVDLDIEKHDPKVALAGWLPGSGQVAFVDGAPNVLPCSLPEEIFPREIFMRYFTRNDGKSVPRPGRMPSIREVKELRGAEAK